MKSRQAVLDTAVQLLDECGWAGFSIDEIARRSRVSKATIYKHWNGRLQVAAEAYGRAVTDAVLSSPVTGDVVADLRNYIIGFAEFYATPRGRVIAQLLAAAIDQPGGADVLRDTFFGPRRRVAVALVKQGMANGQLREDLDPDLTIDVLFGAMVFRLFNGETPLQGPTARIVATTVMRAVAAQRPRS